MIELTSTAVAFVLLSRACRIVWDLLLRVLYQISSQLLVLLQAVLLMMIICGRMENRLFLNMPLLYVVIVIGSDFQILN